MNVSLAGVVTSAKSYEKIESRANLSRTVQGSAGAVTRDGETLLVFPRFYAFSVVIVMGIADMLHAKTIPLKRASQVRKSQTGCDSEHKKKAVTTRSALQLWTPNSCCLKKGLDLR